MRTWIEINEAYVRHNSDIAKRFSRKYISFVLKANAYGHGSGILAGCIERHNLAHYICVAYAEEIEEIRKGGWKGNILVLGYASALELEKIQYFNAECVVFSYESVYEILKLVKRNHTTVSIHIKIDTGMHRLGFQTPQEIDKVCQLLRQEPSIRVKGIMSHCFDPASYAVDNILLQTKRFDELSFPLLQEYPHAFRHMYATGSISVQEKYDMTRCGSALYGLWKSPDHKRRVLEEYPDAGYKPILKWKSRIITIKRVNAGEYIGYNCFYRAEKESIIAIVPVGYSDGYNRLLSGKNGVFLRGEWAPLCGYISMNMMTIDVTHIAGVEVGDEILLVCSCTDERISLANLAAACSMPPIAFSSGFSPHIPRFLIQEPEQ